MSVEFVGFPKIPRLYRDIVITEKIDGTNASVLIGNDGSVNAGSRTRWVFPGDDNYGFAAWVQANADGLREVGPGHHFGEWWGRGVQRGYNQVERHFSLFNAAKWGESRPSCCGVVPVLYRGNFSQIAIDDQIHRLRNYGSVAAPGYPYPEGIVVFHEHSRTMFKVTLDADHLPKGKA